MLTKYVAASFGQQNIRCNAISPGVMLRHEDWERLQQGRSKEHQEVYSLYLEHVMLPRLGRPEDIADAAVFLASDESAYITGQVLSVDGGYTSVAPHLGRIRKLRAQQADAQ